MQIKKTTFVVCKTLTVFQKKKVQKVNKISVFCPRRECFSFFV